VGIEEIRRHCELNDEESAFIEKHAIEEGKTFDEFIQLLPN
jgi:hypothetical protein